jgi:sugar phosphate permease
VDIVGTKTCTTPSWPKPGAAWYAVAVLLLAYTAAYIDRAILTILAEPIQRDLHINDTQLGLLHGFAFVIFYVTLGVPLGLFADRFNRKRLVVGSILVSPRASA